MPPGKLIDLAAFFWSNGRVPAESTSFVFFGSDEGAAASAAAAAYARLEEGGDGWGNEIIDGAAATVDEAVEIGAQLIVTHHPILFRGRKNLCEDDPEGAMLAKLVRAGIALIAMHTNYDSAADGVNDALAKAQMALLALDFAVEAH